MKTTALLLAGGLGTRLLPLTKTVPKCLVPIGDVTLLDVWVQALLAAKVDDALINTHHLAPRVREAIERVNASTGLRLRETFEPTLLGSAGTIHANRALADDADQVLVVYSDNLSDVRLTNLLEFHQGHAAPFTMLLFRAPNPRACGIATLDESSNIVEFSEKPEHPKSDLANAGVYVVDADLYREIADMNVFDIGFEVLPKLVGRMKGYAHEGYYLDIGTLEALEKARLDLQAGRLVLPERTATR